jgi:hypothetical protein
VHGAETVHLRLTLNEAVMRFFVWHRWQFLENLASGLFAMCGSTILLWEATMFAATYFLPPIKMAANKVWPVWPRRSKRA